MAEDNKTKSFADRFASRQQQTQAPGAQDRNELSMAERFAKKEKSMTTEALSNQASSTSSSQADLIYLVKGIDDGRNAWYYVMVERLKLSLFQKALNDDIIHLENYGVILSSAYGDEPPADVTEELKKKYGVN